MRLRHLAEVNPSTPEFDRLSVGSDVTFVPLEAVWADDRLDASRTRSKSAVGVGYTRFREGDILVPKVAPTFQAGRAAIVNDLANGVGAGSTELHVLRARNGVDPRFVRYVVQSELFLAGGVGSFQGVAGLQRVPDVYVKNFPVADLRLDEQRCIADFLDQECAEIARVVSSRTRVLRLLQDRTRAVIDGRLDELSQRYGTVPFRRFVSRISQGVSPECDSAPAGPGEWGVLKISSVKRGVFIKTENKRLPDELAPNRNAEVRPGDLLVTRANTPELVGDAAVVEQDVDRLLLPDLIYRVELRNSADPRFACISIRGGRIRAIIQATARGTSQSMVKLRGEDIRQWPVCNAPKVVQEETAGEIGVVVEEAENLIRLLHRQIDLLAERRRVLITSAVTGRTQEVGDHRVSA